MAQASPQLSLLAKLKLHIPSGITGLINKKKASGQPAAAVAVTPQAQKRVRIPPKEREYLTTNLALLLQAAVPVGEALKSLAETSKSKPLKQVIQHMLQDID